VAKTLGNAYYSAIINHDFSSGTGGSGSVAIAERGVLRRILSATGTTAPGTASSLIINHYRAPTPGGTPAVVQILAVSGTFQMGTTASTLLVFTPTSRVDILEGDVIVTPEGGGDAVRVGKGDLVTFPVGMSCTWEVQKPVRKHYSFS